MTEKEFVEFVEKKADRFFITAGLQINEEFYDLASFSLQQSLELTLRAILLESAGDYPRTHALKSLLRIIIETCGTKCSQSAKSLLEKYTFELNMLEDAYTTSRYFDKTFDEDEVKKLNSVTELITIELRDVC